MIDLKQFHLFVVRPALDRIGLGGLAAERLVIGTALTESGLVYLDQKGRGAEQGWGPALGVCQMERATYDDHWRWLNTRHAALGDKLKSLRSPWPEDTWRQLAGNLPYAVAMCRVHYWRKPFRLMAPDDLDAMAVAYKAFYNTPAGAATMDDFRRKASPVMTLVV